MAEQGGDDTLSLATATNPLTDTFGVLPLNKSTTKTERQWTKVKDINESLAGQTVWIRARLHLTRAKGKLCFLVLRQQFSTIQAVVASDALGAEFLKFSSSIPRESIIDIHAEVVKVAKPISATSQKDFELSTKKLFVVTLSESRLPLLVDDAARPPHIAEKEGLVEVDQSTRLDNRVIDLRTPANQAIFRIQSAVGKLFREFLLNKNFIEIHTPKLIPAASEGGASVFEVTYFETKAYMAQSPQLYKQMAINADFGRVFEIGPVFRAENANTARHLTEFVSLDLEMAFEEHYHEVLDLICEMFISIFDGLNRDMAAELKSVDTQFPFEPITFLRPTLRLTFAEGIKLLREAGVDAGEFDDLSTTHEKQLGDLVKKKYNTDFYVLDKFPLAVRPFYTMPDPADPKYSNSYDIFLRGQEIVSGAQRVHDPVLLEKRLKDLKIDSSALVHYVSSFQHGSFPHAGCGLGLERFVMLFLGLNNIRRTSLFPRDPHRVNP